MHSPLLVSVIIPNYNHAQYLHLRIESILVQTYQNFEIIILDDCSTDNSREVIEQYRENPHVSQIVYNEHNTGHVFAQWRKGIDLAKGDLCWICESDDSCRPTLLEILVHQFEKNEGLALAACQSLSIDESGCITDGVLPPEAIRVMEGQQFIKEYMLFTTFIINAGMAVFSRKAALSTAGLFFDKKLAGTGDWMFWIEVAEQGKVAIVNEPLNFFRRHSGTYTSKREMDGSNSRGRRMIMDCLANKGYLSWCTKNLITVKNLDDVMNQRNMAEDVRDELMRLWYIHPLLKPIFFRLFFAMQASRKAKQRKQNVQFYSAFDAAVRMYGSYDAAARKIYNI